MSLDLLEAVIHTGLEAWVILKVIVIALLRRRSIHACRIVIQVQSVLAALHEGLLVAHSLIEPLLLQSCRLFSCIGGRLCAEVIA